MLAVIKTELVELKDRYGTPRRTLIIDQTDDTDTVSTARDLVPAEDVVVAVTRSGRLCAWPAAEVLDPARGRQKDPLLTALLANTRHTLYLFTETGQVIITPMHQVPRGQGPGDGPNVSEFSSGGVSPVAAGLALPHSESGQGYLFLVSRQGRVKRIALQDLQNVRGTETAVMAIEKGDTLLTAFVTPGESDVILASACGQAIRFAEEDVRAMGLSAAGVWGMKLGKNDCIVGAGPVVTWGELVVVTENGTGKRIDLDQFSQQGRYGQGVIAIPTGSESGPVAAAAVVNLSNRVMFISAKKNSKTVFGRSLPKASRTAKGKPLMSIRDKDKIARLVILET
jgi:DNA gyrase subunit A